MTTSPSEPTVVDIAGLKTALSQFTALQAKMSKPNPKGVGAVPKTLDLGPALGDLVNGAGPKLAAYYGLRAHAVHQAITTTKSGIDKIVDMLTKTIDHYEKHEGNTKTSADNTGTGKTATPAGKTATPAGMR
jgi:hypothetical protein